MFTLKYVPGAIQEKHLNPKKTFQLRREKENMRSIVLKSNLTNWQAKRTWLNFYICIEHYEYGTDANVSQNLKNQNKFITESLLSAIRKHASRK